MSETQMNWEEFKASVSRAAGKLALKAEELEKKAKNEIHRKALSSRLSEEYEKLGKLTYERFTSVCPEAREQDEESTKKIASIIKNIEKLENELARTEYSD